MKSPAQKQTAADVRAALKRYYAQPEYGIVYEVAQSTGFNARRHLDAIAMDLWPSRGLALHGIEIKVDLYDWRREKSTPEKAEEIARFCDFFWVAAPKDIVPVAELPMAWGLLELDGEKITPRKPAEKTRAQEVDRAFLAAIFRAASRPVDPETLDAMLAAARKRDEEKLRQHIKDEAELIAGGRSRAAEHWSQLCLALGDDPGNFWGDSAELIAAVKAVRQSGVAATWNGLRSLQSSLGEYQKRIGEACDGLGIEKPAEKKRGRAA